MIFTKKQFKTAFKTAISDYIENLDLKNEMIINKFEKLKNELDKKKEYEAKISKLPIKIGELVMVDTNLLHWWYLDNVSYKDRDEYYWYFVLEKAMFIVNDIIFEGSKEFVFVELKSESGNYKLPAIPMRCILKLTTMPIKYP